MLIGSIGYIASLSVAAWAFYAYGEELQAVSRAASELRQLQMAGTDAAAIEISQAALDAAVAAASTGAMIVVVSLIVFIASHAFGQGAVIWVFISEIFPNRVRARGQALGSFTHWIFAAAISQTFPLIAEQSAGHIFAFYAACMVGQLLWVVFVMPETEGVPLEEIQRRLRIE